MLLQNVQIPSKKRFWGHTNVVLTPFWGGIGYTMRYDRKGGEQLPAPPRPPAPSRSRRSLYGSPSPFTASPQSSYHHWNRPFLAENQSQDRILTRFKGFFTLSAPISAVLNTFPKISSAPRISLPPLTQPPQINYIIVINSRYRPSTPTESPDTWTPI
jgi:hypothetical protein